MPDGTDAGGGADALRAEVGRLRGLLDASEATREAERAAAAAEHARLTFELGHRVKNTLSVVQALASQTLRGTASRDDAMEAFGARVMALSHANDLILGQSWTTATVGSVARSVLDPPEPRLDADGPEVRLPASAALSLAMALHELATNARRHGALSVASGHVDLTWAVEEAGDAQQRFTLTWTESGGPPAAPPERRGFGLKLIDQSLRSAFGRDVAVTLPPEGLRCTVRAPLPSDAA